MCTATVKSTQIHMYPAVSVICVLLGTVVTSFACFCRRMLQSARVQASLSGTDRILPFVVSHSWAGRELIHMLCREKHFYIPECPQSLPHSKVWCVRGFQISQAPAERMLIGTEPVFYWLLDILILSLGLLWTCAIPCFPVKWTGCPSAPAEILIWEAHLSNSQRCQIIIPTTINTYWSSSLCLSLSPSQKHPIGETMTVFTPIRQLGKLRLTEVKSLVHS